eukprot:10737342-Ditylum_brightwellii.AAC.1
MRMEEGEGERRRGIGEGGKRREKRRESEKKKKREMREHCVDIVNSGPDEELATTEQLTHNSGANRFCPRLDFSDHLQKEV